MFGLITDTHCGVRASSSIFRDYMQWWYDTKFFPDLEQRGIKKIIHAGDFFDSRNAITLADINFILNWFVKRLIKDNITMYIILGNHDVAYRNTNNIHSLILLQSAAPNNVIIIDTPTLIVDDNQKFVLVPWINNENYSDTFDYLDCIEEKDKTIVVGHFEINGAKMSKNAPACESGMDRNLFKDFKEVWSGHFHHKSKIDNIFYIGTPFKYTWEDYYDTKGYHIFKDGNLEFIENEYHLFIEIEFIESVLYAMTKDEFNDSFSNRYVRMVINSEYDKVALLDIISRINNAKPHELQIINNYDIKKKVSTGDSEQKLEVTVTKTTKEYIDQYMDDNKVEMETVELMQSLYLKAIEKMAVGE